MVPILCELSGHDARVDSVVPQPTEKIPVAQHVEAVDAIITAEAVEIEPAGFFDGVAV